MLVTLQVLDSTALTAGPSSITVVGQKRHVIIRSSIRSTRSYPRHDLGDANLAGNGYGEAVPPL